MERLYVQIGLAALAPMAVFDIDREQLTACNSPAAVCLLLHYVEGANQGSRLGHQHHL